MKQNININLSKYKENIDNGLNYIKKGEYNGAISKFEKAIEINNKNYEAYINLANTYILVNKFELATKILFDYLNKNKFDQKVVNYLGDICFHYKLNDQLIKLFKFCESKIKNDIDIHYILHLKGKYFENINQYKKAIASYKNSISINKNYFDNYERLLNLLESINDIESLDKYIKLAFKNIFEPKEVKIIIFFHSLYFYRKKNYKKSEFLINDNNLIDGLSYSDKYYIRVLDLCSKNSEKLKNFEDAFRLMQNRNNFEKSLKDIKKISPNTIIETIDKYKKFYIKKNLKHIQKQLVYTNDSNLVFLVGFPRSGTTLLDTILRTHSRIKVLEEKPILLELRHNFFKDRKNNLSSLKTISQEEKDFIRSNYFKKMGLTKAINNKIIIDKLPLSIIELGFIKCIFPKSKIILALRHPCDVVVSCFFSSFKINEAMVNFLDWNDTINLYNKTFELYEFFENELDLNSYSIKYENVINNFKTEIKALMNFLEVPYENNLESFYITAQKRDKISTPSYTQVINPLYKSSIGKWKNYVKIKDPSLFLNKWIKKFNY